MNARLPVAVALVSASALAFEVLVLRLLTIVHWYQFAAMIIGLALLGYSAAGVVAALGGERLARHRARLMVAAAAAQAVAMPLIAAALQRLPFNGLELVWDPTQIVWLGLMFALLALPFLAAGLVIVSAFQANPQRPGLIYAADLGGAAAGAALAAAALSHLAPSAAIGCCALTAAVGAAYLLPPRSGAHTLPLGAAGLVALLWVLGITDLRISEYKGESLMRAVAGSALIARDFGPDGYLAVIDNRRIPVRHAPGMSLATGREPPPQLAVFRDGDSMTALTRTPGDPAWLEQSVAAAPYALGTPDRVAVLGAGTGTEVERALAMGARRIDAIEHRRALTALTARRDLGVEAPIYQRAEVTLVAEAPRAWLERARERFDLIVYGTDDSLAASAAGVNAALSGYPYTVEAIAAAWRRLTPDGRLAITQWVRVPPRQTVKLAAAVIAALRAEGVAAPGAHLAVVRDWSVACVVVSRRALERADVEALRAFARERGFDLAWLPGLAPEETNRHHRWPRPWLYQLVAAIVSGDSPTLEQYAFDVSPARDDRPWFFNAFRWRTLPLLWEQRATGGLLLLESGYLIIAATLGLALLVGGLLLAIPLPGLAGGAPLALPLKPVTGLFAAIGIAFLGIEIMLIEKLGLWLGRPPVAFATGIAAFLIAAGAGSAAAAALARRLGGARRVLRLATVVLLVWGAVLALTGGSVDGWMLGQAEPMRLALSVALILPAGFAMGQFFPAGLAALGAREPRLVPWAWAVNGAASVIASPLALLLGIHLGLSAVLLISVALYAPALWSASALLRRASISRR